MREIKQVLLCKKKNKKTESDRQNPEIIKKQKRQ